MSVHHLKLNLVKTELLFQLQDLSITVDNSTVSPSQSAMNLSGSMDEVKGCEYFLNALYVNCTLSNRTKISEWVNEAIHTLCVQ
jgi:hypothetical protein